MLLSLTKSICLVKALICCFPLDKDEKKLEVAVLKISRASLFVAYNTLDSVTYNVPKSASAFSPFGPNHVRLEFEEGTFDGDATLEFKVGSTFALTE